MSDAIYYWSQSAADNDDADESINWAEFQSPETVNNSARALMARVAELLSDLAPLRTSTGTSTAYVVAGDSAGATLRNGEMITFIPHITNTGACTLLVAGRPLKPWRPANGVQFAAGNIQVGVPVTAYYRSVDDSWISPGTGYYVTQMASGVALQSITARLPQIGDAVVSLSPTPGPGRIRLTEATQAVLKTSYPELNSYLSGISYPWGSTATHFNLPPAAGYFLRFAATSAAIDTGGARTAGSTQADQNKAHTHAPGTLAADPAGAHSHTYDKTNSAANNGTGSGGGFTSIDGYTTTPTSTESAHTHTISGATAASGGDEVRVKNVAFHLDIVASTALAAAQVAVFGFPFQWDDGTAAADPGAGRVRGNNATLGAITALYFSATDGWGVSLASLIAGLGVGTAINLSKVGGQANRIAARVSSTPTNVGTYVIVPVSVDAAAGTFTASDQLAFEPVRGLPGSIGLFWRNSWQTAIAYAANDGVERGGSSYICITDHTSGASTEPGIGASWATFWNVLASSGGVPANVNLLINGDVGINQRAFAGGALSAGAYGFDRWKAGASGAAVSVAAGVVTLTSGEIQQIIETATWGYQSLASTVITVSVQDLTGGNLTVTVGSTAGTITVGSGQRSVTLTTAVGDTGNLTLKLAPVAGAVTFQRVKLEVGSAATPWHARPLTQELGLCQRYYERLSGTTGDRYIRRGYGSNVGAQYYPIQFFGQKRVAPTVALVGVASTNAANANAFNPSFYEFEFYHEVSASGGFTFFGYTANAEL